MLYFYYMYKLVDHAILISKSFTIDPKDNMYIYYNIHMCNREFKGTPKAYIISVYVIWHKKSELILT